MKRNPTIFLILGVLLVASCAVPGHSPANLAEELNYNSEIQNRYKADLKWWEQYKSPELNKLVAQALENNPDYLKAAINVKKALYRLNLAELDLFPHLTGSLGGSSSRRIDTGDSGNDNFSGEVGLNYELDLYGKIRDLKDAEELELNATVMDRKSAYLTLVNSVVDLYFNLEYLHNTINITRSNIKTYQNLQNITEEKYKSGRVDNLELLEAKQSLISEQTRLLELENQFKEIELSLRNVLNIKENEPLHLQYADILKQKTPKIDLDVPLSVLANRPDLLASSYRLEKAFKNLEAENKNWYPDVSLKGLLGSSADKARTTFDFPYILGSVSVDLPFLDWNRVKNNIKISEAEYETAALEFKEALSIAVNEVAYYYTALEKSARIYENTAENYKNAVKITSYYQNRYNTGKSEFRDYLIALYSENSLKNSMIGQKYQTIKYENGLYKAMAGKYK